jgi:glycyl-tRNA synthetase (class II)
MDLKSIENIVSLCKRRGFIFQSSEIYGGLGSTWDYGPYGVEMKQKIKDFWWHDVVTSRENVVPPEVLNFLLHFYAIWSVIPGGTQASVNLGTLKNETASFTQ